VTGDGPSDILTANVGGVCSGYELKVRITRDLRGKVDGVDLSKYLRGLIYEVGTSIGNYLLCQGWAMPAPPDAPQAVLPLNRTILRPSVLVVDDEEDMRTILSQLLDFHGWPCHVAADGIEGLAALAQFRPSLILLDLAMPRMDGVEFRRRQRELADRRLASTPIVVVSAVHDAPAYRSSLHAADVLVKPFAPDRLLTAVESYVRPVTLFRS
jgi:CheY-like chemotaxis protein